ncbi:phosphatidylethanolamine-binding protein [Polymorphospora rubra]|uniref:Phosphatidylethanolamine-binding protein n=1 Tax=Polymorphospora rubra TaxID=338584 RepID=A0A810N6T2_9ACTN|nr:phosphatidylethanolamine-binding protein [Polymorphospora rubra]BCJ67889.1 hypothetical protein Prubr_49100 [Polymorphospora rubra]
MSGKRPGSHGYDIKRARLRNKIENTGVAPDGRADELANRVLREDERRTGVLRGTRGLGPKGERGPGEPK